MAARILISLLTALALLGSGYWWGASATDNAWAAKEAKTQQATAAELKKETARADAAGGRYLQEHLDQEDRYADLNRTYENLRHRAPLVVPGLVACGAVPGPRQAPDSEQRPAAAIAGSDPVLTLAAVRLWNGALTGTDAPAGACGPAGAPEGTDAACAAASGLTVDDAWRNHAVNAQSCTQDRQRYQHLIDFLNGKRTD